jgi:hypothetical protein
MKIRNFFISVCLLVMSVSPPAWSQDSKELPYYDQIMGIINSLEYSGFAVLTKPEITLSIDFEKQSWMLHNIHQYDEQGGILLEEGKYGLCAELSTYLYQKLQSIVDDKKYVVRLAMATEAGFFPTSQSNHIVLLMHDKATHGIYLIDPSYHKYGRISDFKEYQILGIEDTLTFMKDKSHDVSFKVNQAMPLFIKDDLLLSLSVTSVDGKFDKNNFLIVVTANKREKVSGLNIVIVGKYNGVGQSFEGRMFLEQLLNPQEVDKLYIKLETWLREIESKS